MCEPSGAFGIVGVNHAHVFEPQNAVRFGDGLLQALRGRDIVAGRQQMARVEAKADRQIGHLRGAYSRITCSSSNRPPSCAPAPTVFSTSSISLPNFNPLAAAGDAFEEMQNALLDRLAFVIARMRHQVFGADGDGALQFASERLDRLRADALVRRREIDQIVVVDHQRRQIVAFPRALEQDDPGLARSRRLPLPRAGRKNLERVRAQLGGFCADRSSAPAMEV